MLSSSGIQRCVARMRTDVGRMYHFHISSHLLHVGSLLALFSTLKMEVIRSSETTVHIEQHGAIFQKMVAFITTAVRT
jgi:hypothetical protein